MSGLPANLLRSLDHLEVWNGRFRIAVQTRPATSPQGRFEPKQARHFRESSKPKPWLNEAAARPSCRQTGQNRRRMLP